MKRPCVNCQGQLHYAGNAFRAPPKRDVKEWAKLEVLIRGGMTFNYYGGNGKLPPTANAAKKMRARKHAKHVYVRRLSNGKRVVVKGYNHSQYEVEA